VTTFHPTNDAYMCSVIDNNLVMWDVSESGVKIVCTAVLDGKGMTICILLGNKLYKPKLIFYTRHIQMFYLVI